MKPITKSGNVNIGRLQDGRRRPKQTANASLRPYRQKIKSHSSSSLPELEKVCSDFASIFSYELIKNMRSTIPDSSFLQGFQGKNLINSMVDEKLAQYLSCQNGFGLKELLLNSLRTDTMGETNKSEVIKNSARKEY